MKLREVFERIDRSTENTDGWVELDIFTQALNISAYFGGEQYDAFQQRVTGYWIERWMCTDTEVGTKVFFLDDKPLAYATKHARKNSWYLQFVSQEIVQELYEFIQSLIQPDELMYSFIDLDQDIDDVYHLRYADQVVWFNRQRGVLGDQKIKILGAAEKGYCVELVKIENEQGAQAVAVLEDIDFPIHVNDV